MKTSISTFVHYRYPLTEAIRRYAEMGYDGVEIWGGRPHAYWEDMTDQIIAEIKSVIDGCGLEISNFIPAQFRYPTNLAADSQAVRSKSVDYINRNIEVSAKLGAPSVSLCPGFSMFGQTRKEAWQVMLDSFCKIIEFTKGMPITLLIEPANRWESDLIVTVDDGLQALDDLGNPPSVGILADSGHININQEPLTDIPGILKNIPVHYHLDDNKGVTDDHLVPGEGMMNFDLFFEKLKETGYRGFMAVELGFGYTVDPDPAAKKSLDFLRRYLSN